VREKLKSSESSILKLRKAFVLFFNGKEQFEMENSKGLKICGKT
jgi:hypothetical protein